MGGVSARSLSHTPRRTLKPKHRNTLSPLSHTKRRLSQPNTQPRYTMHYNSLRQYPESVSSAIRSPDSEPGATRDPLRSRHRYYRSRSRRHPEAASPTRYFPHFSRCSPVSVASRVDFFDMLSGFPCLSCRFFRHHLPVLPSSLSAPLSFLPFSVSLLSFV